MYQQQTVMTGQATPVSNSPSVSIVNPQVPTVTNGQPIIVQAQVVQRVSDIYLIMILQSYIASIEYYNKEFVLL